MGDDTTDLGREMRGYGTIGRKIWKYSGELWMCSLKKTLLKKERVGLLGKVSSQEQKVCSSRNSLADIYLFFFHYTPSFWEIYDLKVFVWRVLKYKLFPLFSFTYLTIYYLMGTSYIILEGIAIQCKILILAYIPSILSDILLTACQNMTQPTLNKVSQSKGQNKQLRSQDQLPYFLEIYALFPSYLLSRNRCTFMPHPGIAITTLYCCKNYQWVKNLYTVNILCS